MKDLSLWDKILYSLSMNGSIFHNIFLIIVLSMTATSILFVIGTFIFRLKQASNANQYTNANQASNAAKKPSVLKHVIPGFFALIFPLGLFLLINVSLTNESSAAASDKAFIYDLDGKYVAASVVQRFTVNEIDSGIRYGSTSFEIAGVELESGRLLFNKKIKELKGAGGYVKILCSSQDNVFLFCNGQIIVVNKKTGKTIRSIKSVSVSGDVSLLKTPEACKYDKNTRSIVFKASNALAYAMDINNFIIEEASVDTDKYFDTDDETHEKNLGDGMTMDRSSEKGSFYMFLTDSDIQKLKNGIEVSSSRDNTERRMLYKGDLSNLSKLEKVSQEVFLLGGFLYSNISNTTAVYNSISTDDKNYVNYENIGIRGEAMGEVLKVIGSNLSFIIHRKSLDTDNILLTAIDLDTGKTAWTLDTGASELHECYVPDNDHILLFCENKSGSMDESFNTNSILYVSIKDGTFTGFDFKYDRKF